MARLPSPDIQLDLGENYYDPHQFVEALEFAEELGFRAAWFGDHFVPWFHSGDRSQFIWSTLGAAMERTSTIKTGPLVTTPLGARYHPAVIAQASATLDNLFPGRFLLGVGTGEALNERPFWNGRWPEWNERMDRLVEGLRLIRRLWDSREPFSFDGKYFHADFYHLYTKPKRKIPIYFSAVGKKAALEAGKTADNLVTLSPRNSIERLKSVILPAFKEGRRQAKNKGRGGLVVSLSFSFQTPSALRSEHWRTLGYIRKGSWDLPTPIKVEEEGKRVSITELKSNIHFCKGWNDLIGVIEAYREIGTTAVVLGSGAAKKRIKDFADNILHVF